MEKIWKFRRWAQFELNISQRELLSFLSKTKLPRWQWLQKGGGRDLGDRPETKEKHIGNIRKLSNRFFQVQFLAAEINFWTFRCFHTFAQSCLGKLMQALLRYTVLYKTWSQTFGNFWFFVFKMYIYTPQIKVSRTYYEFSYQTKKNIHIYIYNYIYIWYFSSPINDPIVSPTKQCGLNIRQRSKNQVILISSNVGSSEASPWCWVSR